MKKKIKLGFGIGLLIIGIVSGLRFLHFERSHHKVVAEIIDTEKRLNPKNMAYEYYPVFLYDTPSGKEQRVVASQPFPASYCEKTQQVELYFKPETPQQAMPSPYARFLSIPAFFTLAGLGFLLQPNR